MHLHILNTSIFKKFICLEFCKLSKKITFFLNGNILFFPIDHQQKKTPINVASPCPVMPYKRKTSFSCHNFVAALYFELCVQLFHFHNAAKLQDLHCILNKQDWIEISTYNLLSVHWQPREYSADRGGGADARQLSWAIGWAQGRQSRLPGAAAAARKRRHCDCGPSGSHAPPSMTETV